MWSLHSKIKTVILLIISSVCVYIYNSVEFCHYFTERCFWWCIKSDHIIEFLLSHTIHIAEIVTDLKDDVHKVNIKKSSSKTLGNVLRFLGLFVEFPKSVKELLHLLLQSGIALFSRGSGPL